MDTPERIWAYPSHVTGWNSAIAHDRKVIDSTEYRRADLPPTLEAAKALPEIAALVQAAKGLLFANDHGNGLEGWHNTRERLRAALTAIAQENQG